MSSSEPVDHSTSQNQHKRGSDSLSQEKPLSTNNSNTTSSSSSSEQPPNKMLKAPKKVPVTVLTGFLGAGKSTLINYILSHDHGHKIAIIENEFGEVSIDDALIVTSNEEVVELSNGCLCCTLRGDLIGALSRLSEKKDKFDYILIETTGLALPGPIIQTFYLEEKVREGFYLDGIVTMVDAKHIVHHLHKHHHHEEKKKEVNENQEEDEEEETNEAEDQLAFADRIILNKIELVSEQEKAKVLKKIRKINGIAPILETNHSKVDDLKFLLDIRAFDIDRVLNMDPNLLKELNDEEDREHDEKQHHHHDDHHEHHHHDEHKHSHHDSEVSSYAIVRPGLVDREKFEDWLLDLLTEQGEDIYRTKGFLNVGEAKPLVVQAVHSLLDMRPFGEWKNGDTTNKLVFIGKYIDRDELLRGFEECLIQTKENK
ncbi:hypothetical protein C9374_000452 [Naegleria lovaniensis]|uniref:CobW C-terminal domain-containing protein n=1 Tax=Naegleria lovaniensis TaxID=51637 RepID=A0AA88GZ41_NAELO|nr:uncharacterized protein C9374_000452 [Naegleria lovaniensis]KAG2388288.1 hypothetical protein C9374_000452 [Naegleria lovaniensis]